MTLIFMKLGGSLITDKRAAEQFQAETMHRAAREIASARRQRPDLSLLIGHGSGSFGHVAARRYGTAVGVHTAAEWRGFAEVATIARRLNTLVIDALLEADLPIIGFQPSSSALSENGRIKHLETRPLIEALAHDLIPVIYGDVSFDSVRGGTIISTETEFFYLAEILQPAQIFLLGEEEGVYDSSRMVIQKITPGNLHEFVPVLGGSGGTDVTGGMATKVRLMVELAGRMPGLQIRIFGGTRTGQLEAALLGDQPGTLICGE